MKRQPTPALPQTTKSRRYILTSPSWCIGGTVSSNLRWHGTDILQYLRLFTVAGRFLFTVAGFDEPNLELRVVALHFQQKYILGWSNCIKSRHSLKKNRLWRRMSATNPPPTRRRANQRKRRSRQHWRNNMIDSQDGTCNTTAF